MCKHATGDQYVRPDDESIEFGVNIFLISLFFWFLENYKTLIVSNDYPCLQSGNNLIKVGVMAQRNFCFRNNFFYYTKYVLLMLHTL